MLNKIILIGRLTADPELRYTDQGVSFATFDLAVDRNYSNKDGERETDFISVITWRKLAENCASYLGKGRLVAVEGNLQIRKNKKNDRTYINPQVLARNVKFLDWPDQELEQVEEEFETPF